MGEITEKVIWVYWAQGWNNAPYIVKKCIKSIEKNNEDWVIIKLDNKNVTNYINIKFRIDTIQSLSDYIRVSILKKYGGIWCDSTIFCNYPFSEWINNYGDFFIFSNPTDNIMICSWFIYSKKNSYIIDKWKDECDKFWTKMNSKNIFIPKDYFWFHKLFKKLYKNNKVFKDLWDKNKKIDCSINSRKGPHLFAPYNRSQLFVDEEFINDINKKITPIYKLTIKWDLSKDERINYMIKKQEL